MPEPAGALSALIPLSPPGKCRLEQVPEGEGAAIAEVAAMIADQVRATAQRNRFATRDAHPKAHGTVRATVRVYDDLPDPLRAGLFAAPRVYPCWIRFSNGAGSPQPDTIGDARGMAIKVLAVPESRSGTQDFILIDNPVFFVRNAADYVVLQGASSQLRFFFPGLNPFAWRLHELFAALGITRRKVSNPLNTRYWSMSPYLFGDRACKFSCRPIGPPPPFESRVGDDFLHDNLVATLAQADAAFELCVQLQGDPAAMPVEDPTISWDETSSPSVALARIDIPRQDFDTPERRAFGENLSFTPWHGLDAHRPLGGINRARRTVYETISALRHELNGVPRVEPGA